MGKRDSRVDAYIDGAADFAKPILNHLRRVVHAGCPEVEETLKWGVPHFEYKGILCSMAAFQNHCAFGFWKEALLGEKPKAPGKGNETAMGPFGRIRTLSDLPGERILLRYVREAVSLNERGVKLPARPKPKGDRKLEIPSDFRSALRKNRKSLATFTGFSYSNQKEYVEWVTGATGEETRKRRLDTAVAWMAEGKVRNWKYIRK